jgi:hypothetical protein
MLRVSLREAFIFVALVALATASLKYANDTWISIVAAIMMLSFFVALIIAVVDRGPRQAFAIGFVLVAAAYGYLVVSATHSESNRVIEFYGSSGRLPTTRLLNLIYQSVNTSDYYDNATGQPLPGFDPATESDRLRLSIQMPGGGMVPGVSFRQIPEMDSFMRVGHCWWALILGCAGGYFAQVVYRRRLRDEQKLPAETS